MLCNFLTQLFPWRGNFKSTKQLKQRILAFIDFFNQTLAKPFRWTYLGKLLLA
jgi:hypothetical protein